MIAERFTDLFPTHCSVERKTKRTGVEGALAASGGLKIQFTVHLLGDSREPLPDILFMVN